MPNNSSAGSEILSRLQQAPTIHPASARLFTDWSLEPGDVVTVKSDEEAYMLPIYSMLMEWTGAPMVDVSSSGNQKREPLPALTRRDYATRSAINGMRQRMEDQEEINQQYQHFRTETNQQLTSVYKITGVKLDRYGRPIYQQAKDAQGNPLWETDEQGNPVYDTDLQGNIIYEMDEHGNYVLDEHGNKIPRKKPVYVVDEAGNPVPVYDPDSTGSISSSITQTAQSLNILYEQTGGVTEQFDKEKQYHAGDYVLSPNGVSCRFKVDHLGPWNNEDVVFVANLRTQIQTTADGLSTKVEKEELTQTLSSYITQTAFKNAFGNTSIDNKGKIVIAEVSTAIVNGIGVATISADKIILDGETIINKINGTTDPSDVTGQTYLKISANNIELDGLVTVSDLFSEGGAYVQDTIHVGGLHVYEDVSIDGGITTSADSDIVLGTVECTSLTALEFLYVGDIEITNAIVAATVGNNTLTLTDASGNTVNFSKATTLNTSGTYTVNGTSVTAGWSGGTYTVVATQTNYNTTTEDDETTVVGTASTTIRSVVVASAAQGTVVKTDMNVTMKVLYDNGDPESNGSETGFTSESIAIDATDVYNYGRNSVNVTGPTWAKSGSGIDSSNTATFTTNAPQPNANASKALALTLSTTLTVNNYNAGSIPIGCTATVSDGTSTVLTKTDSKALGISFEAADAGTATPTQLASNTTYALKVTKDGASQNIAYYSTPLSQESGIASLMVTALNNQMEYDALQADEVTVETDTYYKVTATPEYGSAVVKKFHSPPPTTIVGMDSFTDIYVSGVSADDIGHDHQFWIWLRDNNGTTSDRFITRIHLIPGGDGRTRTASGLSPIALLASDAGSTVSKSVTVYYENESEPTTLSITVDATAITGGGGTSANIQTNRTYTVTANTDGTPITISPSSGYDAMSQVSLTVNVPSGTTTQRTVHSLEKITLPSTHTGTAYVNGVTVFYSDDTEGSVNVQIDASAVFQAGQQSASGDTGGISGITYDNTSSSTNTNNSTVYTNWAKNTSIALPQQYQYALLTVNAKDGSEYKVGINASAVYTAGRNSVSLGTKRITSNNTYNASNDGYNGYSSVTVDVPKGYDSYRLSLSLDSSSGPTQSGPNYINTRTYSVTIQGSQGGAWTTLSSSSKIQITASTSSSSGSTIRASAQN